MRFFKPKWLLISAALLIAGGIAVLFFSPSNVRERRLADGSTLRIEKIAFGKRETVMPGTWLDNVKSKIPPSLLGMFAPGKTIGRGNSSWWQNARMHTNDDALYVYITRRDTLLGGFQNVDVNYANIIDEHGCVFASTQAGGEDRGLLPPSKTLGTSMGMQSSLNWYRFEAFPRREKSFRLRFFDQRMKLMTEFTIHNPAPPPAPTNWVVHPFPISITNGDTVFSLASVELKSNSQPNFSSMLPLAFYPKYEATKSGKPSPEWEALDTELYDSAGNFCGGPYDQSHPLCWQEPSWKLLARFFGSESASSASNAVWTLTNLVVPANGKLTLLNETNELQGVRITAVAFGGPGDFVYQNDVPGEAKTNSDFTAENSLTEHWRNGSRKPDYNLHGNSPHLAMTVGKLTDDQRLTIRATDDQGRQFYAVEWRPWQRMGLNGKKAGKIHYMGQEFGDPAPFYLLELPSDSKTVDISICIHQCFRADYIFKPPHPQVFGREDGGQ